MNWKKLCTYLYENINPQSGTLHSYVNNQYNGGQFINFYLEFDMNEFIYEDPFYGEQSSTSMFKTNFELMEVSKSRHISDIVEFQNLNIIFEQKRKFGSFSNSLHLVPHTIGFNDINNGKLNCGIEYSIVNSDSYGMMDGSFQDHISLQGTIHSELEIAKLVVNCKSREELKRIIAQLNTHIYDINSYELFQKTQYSNSYRINYKDGIFENIQERQKTITI